jgi:hypothetical protein
MSLTVAEELPDFFLLITGSRDAKSRDNKRIIHEELNRVAMKVSPTEYRWHFVDGDADGSDREGRLYLLKMRWVRREDVHLFPVTDTDWKSIGKTAGHKRNQTMVDFVSRQSCRKGVVAFPAEDDYTRFRSAMASGWEKQSCGGTCDCIRRAEEAGLRVHVRAIDVAEERAARLARRRAFK